MSDLDDDELRATRILNGVEKEIEVGDYIRNKQGLIIKYEIFKKYDNGEIFFGEKGKGFDFEDEEEFIDFKQNDIKKHSKNIIDLIEEGDYVNGSKVIDIAQGKTKAVYIESQEQKFALIPIVEKQIKSIVTKEQFTKMKYKVKE